MKELITYLYLIITLQTQTHNYIHVDHLDNWLIDSHRIKKVISLPLLNDTFSKISKSPGKIRIDFPLGGFET